MVLYNPPHGIRVLKPAEPEWAFHVCRYPVEAPKPWERAIWLPAPLPDASAKGMFARQALFLPGPSGGTVWPILEPDIDPTVAGLWVEMAGTPLTIPLIAEQERRFEEDWRTKAVCNPSGVWLPFEPSSHSRLGWAVLARIAKPDLIGTLALLACVFECRGTDPEFLENFVTHMGLPRPYKNKLLAAARGGQPILDPKAIRWILTEIAAADQAELERYAAWRPPAGSDEELLARALLPIIFSDRQPGWEHLRTALWLLHDEFYGSDSQFTSTEDILAGVTALGCATAQAGAWVATLDRWRAIWSIPDSHRAVQDASMSPSAIRALYATELGLDPVAWLAGVSFINLRWWWAFQSGALQNRVHLPLRPNDLLSANLESEVFHLSGDFETALRSQLVANIDEFCAQARPSAGYQGLGSLSQTESLACRNHPILQLPGDILVPISLNLIAERAAVRHRWLLPKHFKGLRALNAAVGYMFESYIDDLLSDKAGRTHRVLSEDEITYVLGQSSRCDLAVVQGSEWLLVETSMQTIERNVVLGHLTSIDDLCLRYHGEADQAEATGARAEDLATAYGLPKPSLVSTIVVVDNSAPHSPALMGRLHQLRPGRNPRFVVSATELEAMAEMSARGWSLIGAVRHWQTQAREGPISLVTAELARLIGPNARPTADEMRDWLADLPKEPPKAA